MADPTLPPTDPIVPSATQPAAVKATHYVPLDGPFYLRRYQKARCGKIVDPLTEHALEPTCPRCAELQATFEGLVC